MKNLNPSDPFCGRVAVCEKDFYIVYEAFDENDLFSYDHDKEPLCKTPNLAVAHSIAFWMNEKYGKIYTIIQDCDKSCRGGYGFKDDE